MNESAPARTFRPGQLVTARGRDWVVLPANQEGLLRLRPLAGADAEEAGVYIPVEREPVRSAEFPRLDATRFGDTDGLLTLFDAARLGLRSGAAPFRSLGRISVAPRPYQFVPLLLALRLAPVRLLIADDVGVGKTIEAALIARELLDRGVARRLAVLCPAHLCDQWQTELAEKFGLDADVVQPSTMARLERRLPRRDLSVYGWARCLVASIDFVKSDRQRDHFLRHAPDLIIVDEAHGAARPPSADGRTQQQRHELLLKLTADAGRHLMLVTATPHSGIEESFRSLIGLLDPVLARVADEKELRRRLQPHLVQRRRKDVELWLGANTPFPEREPTEESYRLGGDYRQLFEDVLAYCRGAVAGGAGMRAQQRRVRHWAAIALLRCVLSSPATAAAVLTARAQRIADGAGDDDPDAVDRAYRPQVMDALGDLDAGDGAPTAPVEDPLAAWSEGERRRLREFARRAAELGGQRGEAKLAKAKELVAKLLADGYRPILFCRFIDTANYLADHLGRQLSGVDVRAVTGALGDEERRERIAELVESRKRVLVATDCLSEGINLQEHFDAVLHYDLPWNPNRLEQREGRVDRYGQERAKVRTVLLYGADNEIDLIVLEVLLRKARAIRKALGIAVPVPADAEQVIDALVDGVLLRRRPAAGQLELGLGEGDVSRLHSAWDKAASRQKAYFAQATIDPTEVARELSATDDVLGDAGAVERFMRSAVQRLGGRLEQRVDGAFDLWPGSLEDRAPKATGGWPMPVVFDTAASGADRHWLGRNHPVVAAASEAILGEAFDGQSEPPVVARCAVTLTDAVARVTWLPLLRLRWRLEEDGVDGFAEEIRLAAVEDADGTLRILEPLADAGRELAARAHPVGDLDPQERRRRIEEALARLTKRWWQPIVDLRRKELVEAHRRLRRLTGAGGFSAEAYAPDLMGLAVLVPAVRRHAP